MIDTLPFPLRTSTADDAAVLSALFRETAFTETTLCERLGIPALDAVDMPIFKTFADRLEPAGALSALARLFLFGALLPGATLRGSLAEVEIAALVATDLLRQWRDGASDEWYCPVRVVPVRSPRDATDLLMAGDRGDHPDGSTFTPFADIVFSGHNPLTRQFLRLLPDSAGKSVLDLGSGTGIAALTLAASSASAAAVDIAQRSTHFTNFNAWLNGVDGVHVLCGDLYEPVRGRQFDCIVAHPPYVPSLSDHLTYRDGGETGDRIIQGVVCGLGNHLAPGGTFLLLCLGIDTVEQTFETRARDWLGAAAGDFDLIFAMDSSTPPELIATRLIERSRGTVDELQRWRELFTRLHVKDFVYGALVGRRASACSPRLPRQEPVTRRVLLTESTDNASFVSLFDFLDWMRQEAGTGRVLGLKPKLPDGARLDVQHRVVEGSFAPAGFHVENGGHPFFARLAVESWVAALLGGFDGTRSVRDVFATARDRGVLPATFGDDDMERTVLFLAERGCLDLLIESHAHKRA